MCRAGMPGAVLLALWLAAGAGGAEAAQFAEAAQVDLELILAVDVSGSVDEEEAHLQREGYLQALVDPGVIRAIRAGRHKRVAIAYVEWSSDHEQRLTVGWTLVKDEATAKGLAAQISAASYISGRFTSISGVIDYSVPLFGKAYKGRRRVIDISGDGPNNRGRPVALARDQAVAKGIVINGIVIMDEKKAVPWGLPPVPHLDLYFRNCVVGGPGSFLLAANDFKDFARAIRRKLILEIVGLTPAERPVLAAASQSRWPLGNPAAAQPSGVPHCDAYLHPARNFEGF